MCVAVKQPSRGGGARRGGALFLGLGLVFTAGLPPASLAQPVLPAPVLVDNGGMYTQAVTDLPVGNTGYTHPADNPAAPGDSYNPPVGTNTPSTGVPGVTAFTPQASADRTVLMQGGAFTIFAGSESGKDTRVWSTDGRGAIYQPQLLRVTSQALAILMAPPSGDYGMYLTWAENANGVGYPVRVNGTEAWWVGPNHAVAGTAVKVYGRNLAYQNGTNSAWVYVRPWSAGPGTASRACGVTQVNPYRVSFTVPGDLAPGDYEIWAHNGHGGQYGWSGPLKLKVDATVPYQWNGTRRNAKDAPYNAVGDGVTDDRAALQSAINASQPGDIVYLPAGTYLISSRLQLGNGIALEGAGAGGTVISPYSSSYNDVALLNSHWTGTNRLSQLRLSNSFASASILWGMYTADNGGNSIVPFGIIIDSCSFATDQNVHNQAIYIVGLHDIWITNCTFRMSGPGVVPRGCVQVFVNHNSFYGNASQDSPTAYSASTCQESDYSDNAAASLDRTSNQAVNRLFTTGANGSSVFNVYFGDNLCSACGPLPTENNQNSGEMILWENEDVIYTGFPSAVGQATLTYSGVDWPGWQFTSGLTFLYIDQGPGLGAWRRVLANTTNTITVDHDWDCPPTTASHTLLVHGGTHTVTYHNTVDGIPDYATRNCASVGVSSSISFDCVVANNTVTHTRGGLAFLANADPSNSDPVNPTNRFAAGDQCNNLVVNNSVSNSYAGIQCAAYIWDSGSGPTNLGPVMLNNVLRDNLLSNIETAALSVDWAPSMSWNWPWLQHNVFEHNTCIDFGKGMKIGAEQGYTLVRRNSFWRTDAFTASGFTFNSGSLWPYLYENDFSSQINPPNGPLPGAGLNVGTRRFEFAGTLGGPSPAAQSATVWNIGTAPLIVTILSDQPWLSAALSSTAIPANTNATLTVSVDPAELGVGTYAGNLMVVGGDYGAPETLSVTFTLRAGLLITSISRSGDDVQLSWTAAAGTTNVVQCASALGSASLFTDLGTNIIVLGTGMVTNTYTDVGGATNASTRLYRVRMVP